MADIFEMIFKPTLDLNGFDSDVLQMKETYTNAKTEIEQKKINAVINQEGVKESFDAAFEDISGPESFLGTAGMDRDQWNFTKDMYKALPEGIKAAMSVLTDGLKSAYGMFNGYIKRAGETFGSSFNFEKFNNNVRFQGRNIANLWTDFEQAYISYQKLSDAEQRSLNLNHAGISSLVNYAIKERSMNGQHETDSVLSKILATNQDYDYIQKALKQYGFETQKSQEEALNFALRTSRYRTLRRSAGDFEYAGLTEAPRKIGVLAQVPQKFETAYLFGGRMNKNVPGKQQARDKTKDNEDEIIRTYQNFMNTIKHGNSFALKSAQETGLVSMRGGRYKFADPEFVRHHPEMIDQMTALALEELKSAVEGPPEHRRSITKAEDEAAILRKENKRIGEVNDIIFGDIRQNAFGFLDPNYSIPKNVVYKGRKYNPSELSIPEMVSIPQVVVQNRNGKAQFMVQRKDEEDNPYLSENLNYEWSKKGVKESSKDEWIKIGRNPIVDAVYGLHKKEGLSFTNRTIAAGRARDVNGRTIENVPLFAAMTLDEMVKKSADGQIQFVDKDGKRTA